MVVSCYKRIPIRLEQAHLGIRFYAMGMMRRLFPWRRGGTATRISPRGLWRMAFLLGFFGSVTSRFVTTRGFGTGLFELQRRECISRFSFPCVGGLMKYQIGSCRPGVYIIRRPNDRRTPPPTPRQPARRISDAPTRLPLPNCCPAPLAKTPPPRWSANSRALSTTRFAVDGYGDITIPRLLTQRAIHSYPMKHNETGVYFSIPTNVLFTFRRIPTPDALVAPTVAVFRSQAPRLLHSSRAPRFARNQRLEACLNSGEIL